MEYKRAHISYYPEELQLIECYGLLSTGNGRETLEKEFQVNPCIERSGLRVVIRAEFRKTMGQGFTRYVSSTLVSHGTTP